MGTRWKHWGDKGGEDKELATLPHKADGPWQVSSLTGTTQHIDRIWDLLLLRFQYDKMCSEKLHCYAILHSI